MHKYSVTMSFNLYAMNLQTRIFSWSDASSVNKIIVSAFFNNFIQQSLAGVSILFNAVGCVSMPAAPNMDVQTLSYQKCLFSKWLHRWFMCNNFCSTFFFKENIFYKVPCYISDSLYEGCFKLQGGATVQPQIYNTFYSFDITATIAVVHGLGSFVKHLIKVQELLFLEGLCINEFHFSFLQI